MEVYCVVESQLRLVTASAGEPVKSQDPSDISYYWWCAILRGTFDIIRGDSKELGTQDFHRMEDVLSF